MERRTATIPEDVVVEHSSKEEAPQHHYTSANRNRTYYGLKPSALDPQPRLVPPDEGQPLPAAALKPDQVTTGIRTHDLPRGNIGNRAIGAARKEEAPQHHCTSANRNRTHYGLDPSELSRYPTTKGNRVSV